MKKGERLRDTVQTIEAMGVDAIVVRHALGRRAAPGRLAGSTPSVDQRRRRLARAPHPGAARLLHAPPAAAASLDGLPHRHRRRHQALAGWPARDVLAFTALGAEVTLVAPPTLLPPSARRLAGDGEPRPRRRAPRGRRRVPAAHAARAHDRGAVPDRCASTPRATGSPRARGRCCSPTRWSCTPGPMNRGRRDRRRGRRPAQRR